PEGVVELLVRPALDVGGSVRLEGTPGDVERAVVRHHPWFILPKPVVRRLRDRRAAGLRSRTTAHCGWPARRPQGRGTVRQGSRRPLAAPSPRGEGEVP